jgi:predicted ATPase
MHYENKQAFVITGAPGTGKTTLLDAIKLEGVCCMPEPARSIIEEQRLIEGEGIYDLSPLLFKELMLSRMIYQYKEQYESGLVFFDRGIPDIIAYSHCFGLATGAEWQAAQVFRYSPVVFMAPCWEEIFENDQDRQLSFSDAKNFEYDLKKYYINMGYQVLELPLESIENRKDFILDMIKGSKV